MYAVVKTGGKQLKVVVGETVSVELLDAQPGAVVTLPALLVNDGENMLVGDDAAKATVTAEVLGHGKADKVMIFKLKKRKGYKRTRGHRQDLTLIKVTDIALAGAKKAAKAAETAVVTEKPAAASKRTAAKTVAPKKAEAAAKPVAVKKPVAPKAEVAEKPVAKKPAAVKKPTAAKKTAAPKAEAADRPAAKKPAVKKPAAKKTTKPAEPAE